MIHTDVGVYPQVMCDVSGLPTDTVVNATIIDHVCLMIVEMMLHYE